MDWMRSNKTQEKEQGSFFSLVKRIAHNSVWAEIIINFEKIKLLTVKSNRLKEQKIQIEMIFDAL